MNDTEDDLRAVVEQAHQLHELKVSPGWAVLEDWVLRGPVGTHTKHRRLAGGDLKSMEEYCSVTGFLQGVEFVLNAYADVDKLAVDMRKRLDRNRAA